MPESLVRDGDLRIACDSLLSWCAARHRNTPEQKREVLDLVGRLRSSVEVGPETEPQRVNRVMREVLAANLARLNLEAREWGWL
jgi:hypothetical protein